MHAGGRVLIAGCGYVGKSLGTVLARAGFDVFGLRRDTTRLPEEIQRLGIDLLDRSALARLPGPWDTVFYLTGASGRTVSAYREAYVMGLENLLETLVSRGGKGPRVIFASSTGVYGQRDGSWVDENTQLGEVSGPAACLVEGEHLVAQSSLRSVVMRFGGIYGPGRSSLLGKIRLGQIPRSEWHVYTNRIHLSDCVGVLRHVMHLEDPAQLYLAVDDEPVTMGALVVWLAGKMNASLPEASPSASTARSRSNKRCRNALLHASGYSFRYPSFREGYGALLSAPTTA